MSNVKDTNPKDALGIKKVPMSTLPVRVLWRVGLAMLEGSLKYGRSNYRIAGVRGSVYFDAAFRHLTSWWEGQDTDPDSGLNHLDKALASLFVLRDGTLTGNWNDDRPPRTCDVDEEMLEFSHRIGKLQKQFPEPVQPYTQACLNDDEAAMRIRPPEESEVEVFASGWAGQRREPLPTTMKDLGWEYSKYQRTWVKSFTGEDGWHVQGGAEWERDVERINALHGHGPTDVDTEGEWR